MLGKEKVLDLLVSAVAKSPAQETEIRLLGGSSYLTRYSDNYVHQNVGETGYDIEVRAVNSQRIGSASVNQVDEVSLAEAIKQAHDLSHLIPPTPEFPGLPAPLQAAEPKAGFYHSTAECPADLRAACVDRVVAMAKKNKVKVAGALSTDVLEMAVVNSRGVRAYGAQTRASLTCAAMGADSSGYAEEHACDIASVDPTRVAERAIRKCILSKDPVSIPPGEYQVILEPGAVRSMLLFAAFMGLGGESYQEGRSFMSGRLGQKIVGDNITLWDDGLDPAGLPMPFDFEGVPKQKVMLIDRGVAAGVVYGSLAAAKEGKESTGHAILQMGFTGSMPVNIFMAGGDSNVEDMIASTKKGVLVTRFHYVNPVHPVKAVITGMTRDGTFLIEDGRIVRGVRNLRFTESILGALSRVESISSEREMSGGFLSIVCPAIKVNGFTFTGSTEF